MPILRLTSGIRNEKTSEFHGNFEEILRENPANSQVSNPLKSVLNGCNQCNSEVPKFINVYEIGKFCSRECWNNWIRENGSRITIKKVVPEGANSKLDYRLRNDEEYLSQCRINHESIIPLHSSIYICDCAFSKTYRARELGLTHNQMVELESRGEL